MTQSFMSIGIGFLLLFIGCTTGTDDSGSSGNPGGGRSEYALPQGNPAGVTHGEIVLDSMSDWMRHPDNPIYHYDVGTGTHRIFYIGYADGDPDTAYEAELYTAEADSIQGPYAMSETPIIANGTLGRLRRDRTVSTMW